MVYGQLEPTVYSAPTKEASKRTGGEGGGGVLTFFYLITVSPMLLKICGFTLGI